MEKQQENNKKTTRKRRNYYCKTIGSIIISALSGLKGRTCCFADPHAQNFLVAPIVESNTKVNSLVDNFS